MTHYKLTDETIVNEFGTTLYRIELTKDCVWGKAGTKGGYIEKESNLSGDAWVYGDARVEVTSDYMTISSLGNSARTITITFSDKMIAAGCFRGTLAEFKAAVNSKYNGEGNYYPTIAYIETLFNQKNK